MDIPQTAATWIFRREEHVDIPQRRATWIFRADEQRGYSAQTSETSVTPQVPALQGALAARAALGALEKKTSATMRSAATTYDADEVEALGGEAFFFDEGPPPPKNDAFLDDTLDELLEMGGDPTFLEQARDEPSDGGWDGVEDDTAHFFDDE